MKTAFSTGPGFFAADTSGHDRDLPPGVMRVYCARMEAYDLPIDASQEDLDTNFQVLFSQAEGNPEIAKAMLKLSGAIESNRKFLESQT